MNVQTNFNLSKPGLFQRITSRLGEQNQETELRRASWELEDESRSQIEDALSVGTFDEKVANFSKSLSELKAKEEPRSLYAATVLGMRHLNSLNHQPMIDVVTCASSAAAHCLTSAMGSFLTQLTDATVTGLETYQKDPQGDPFELAAQLEDKVGWIADDMAPALERIHPQVHSHIEIYDEIAMSAQRHDGSILRALGQEPDRPLAKTLKEAIELPRRYGGNEFMTDIHHNVLSHLEVHSDENSEIKGLVQRSYDAVRGDWTREALMEALGRDDS